MNTHGYKSNRKRTQSWEKMKPARNKEKCEGSSRKRFRGAMTPKHTAATYFSKIYIFKPGCEIMVFGAFKGIIIYLKRSGMRHTGVLYIQNNYLSVSALSKAASDGPATPVSSTLNESDGFEGSM